MMKKIKFYKYQGAGNDFVIIDNRELYFPKKVDIINKICNRHFGIGADGLILVENDNSSDFKMVYYNSDGKESTMCGNGGRCIVAFAKELNIIDNKTTFRAIDGLHEAVITNDIIKLKMRDVDAIEINNNNYIIDTGSPHYVKFIENISQFKVKEEAKKIRFNTRFNEIGINVNFVETINNELIKVRTYERGVENETLACGTGVTASALAYAEKYNIEKGNININVVGGKLKVCWGKNSNRYINVFLEGPAQLVFKGKIQI